jgi:hypothetical protein
MGVGGQHRAPAALSPGKRPGTRRIGGCVGPKAGLGGCGKSHPYQDSIPGPYILFILEVWINCLFIFEFNSLVLLDCQLIPKTLVSNEDKSSLLLQHCVVCFILSSAVIHISDVSHVTPLSRNSTVQLNLQMSISPCL